MVLRSLVLRPPVLALIRRETTVHGDVGEDARM